MAENGTSSKLVCPICHEPFGADAIALHCYHVFCLQCLLRHLQIRSVMCCPLCRRSFNKEMVDYLKAQLKEDYVTASDEEEDVTASDEEEEDDEAPVPSAFTPHRYFFVDLTRENSETLTIVVHNNNVEIILVLFAY